MHQRHCHVPCLTWPPPVCERETSKKVSCSSVPVDYRECVMAIALPSSIAVANEGLLCGCLIGDRQLEFLNESRLYLGLNCATCTFSFGGTRTPRLIEEIERLRPGIAFIAVYVGGNDIATTEGEDGRQHQGNFFGISFVELTIQHMSKISTGIST